MKILIVEDDADLREITIRSLEKERYVVSQAPDYRTALCKIEDYDYDCILLDIMLPDGSGLDLLEELKAMGKRTNVIILSSKDSLEDKVQGLDLGADDYRFRVMVEGKEVDLNRKEYDILYYFMCRPGRLVNKNTLAESVWGDHIDQVDNFDFIYTQIKNLRKRLKEAGATPELKSVYGFGYKFVVE